MASTVCPTAEVGDQNSSKETIVSPRKTCIIRWFLKPVSNFNWWFFFPFIWTSRGKLSRPRSFRLLPNSISCTLSSTGSPRRKPSPFWSSPPPQSEHAASELPVSFSPPVFCSWRVMLTHGSRAQEQMRRRCESSGSPYPSVFLPSHKGQMDACSLLSYLMTFGDFWPLSYFLWQIRHLAVVEVRH